MTATPAVLLRQAADRLRRVATADADCAAVMHPGVGVALAAWLESEARRLGYGVHPDWQETVAPHAVAVARAVLGVPDPAAGPEHPRGSP